MRWFVVLLLCFVSIEVVAQQMLVLKRGSVIGRYNLGDDIRFFLKDDPKQERHAAILSIREFAFITLQKDTIQFSQISKLRSRNPGRVKYALNTMITGFSIGLLGLALEGPFGDKNPQAIQGMYYVAGLGAVTGTLMILTSRSTTRLNGKKRLKFINYDSPMYK